MRTIEIKTKWCPCCDTVHEVKKSVYREHDLHNGIWFGYDAVCDYCDKTDSFVHDDDDVIENIKSRNREAIKIVNLSEQEVFDYMFFEAGLPEGLLNKLKEDKYDFHSASKVLGKLLWISDALNVDWERETSPVIIGVLSQYSRDEVYNACEMFKFTDEEFDCLIPDRKCKNKKFVLLAKEVVKDEEVFK